MSVQPPTGIENGSPETVSVEAARNRWREAALAVPQMAKLFYGLARDPRVPPRSKTFAGFMVAYLISPFDIVPDFVPILGKTDDLVLVAFALNHLVHTAGDDVVREHWEGEDDVLDLVLDVVDFIAGLVPKTIRVALNRLLHR